MNKLTPEKRSQILHLLCEAFHRVAPNKLQLGASPSKPLYTLMFACSNPSDRAFGAALRIANHLLKS